MGGEPRRRRLPQSSLLLLAHHFRGITKLRARLLLHLAKHEPAAAPYDQVELVVRDPDVGAQDTEPAKAVPQRGAPLGALAGNVHLGKLRRTDARDCHGLRTEVRIRRALGSTVTSARPCRPRTTR